MPTIAEKIAAEALAKGLAAGRAEGQAALLLKQMTLRFGALPEWVVARVQSAGVDELERWAERVLVATTLDELLAVWSLARAHMPSTEAHPLQKTW